METEATTTEACLSELRDRIDVLNDRILALIQERAGIVLEIAGLKQAHGLCAYDPQREEEMLRRLTAVPTGAIGAADIREIFTAIFRACLVIQNRAPSSARGGSQSRSTA